MGTSLLRNEAKTIITKNDLYVNVAQGFIFEPFSSLENGEQQVGTTTKHEYTTPAKCSASAAEVQQDAEDRLTLISIRKKHALRFFTPKNEKPPLITI